MKRILWTGLTLWGIYLQSFGQDSTCTLKIEQTWCHHEEQNEVGAFFLELRQPENGGLLYRKASNGLLVVQIENLPFGKYELVQWRLNK